jgi:hypothetical protein
MKTGLLSIFVSLVTFHFTSAMTSPFTMNLTAGMKAASNHLSSAILIALNINKNVVSEESKFAAGSVLEKHVGEYGSLCFVVRRPG